MSNRTDCCDGQPCDGCCGADGTCGACTVFVSSGRYEGDFGNQGGLAGADARCQELAEGANLPGTYKAWLSISNGASPATRFRKSAQPYRMVNGTDIATSWTDLITEKAGEFLRAQLNVMEDGLTASGQVWTATRTDGTFRDSDPVRICQDWTSTASGDRGWTGISTSTNNDWTEYEDPVSLNCAASLRLYCFQQK